MSCWNVAHAGYEGYLPNSWVSIEKIVNCSCDVLEMDVRREGSRLYLSHDWKGQTSHCVGLEDALCYVREHAPEKWVGIDLKEPVFEAVQKLAVSCGMDGKIIYTGDVLLRDLQKDRGKNKVFYNLENSMGNVTDLPEKMTEILNLFELLKQNGADGVNMDYHFLDSQIAELLVEQKLVGAVWTVDEEAEMKRMLRLGAGSITTRYPGKLAELIAEGEKS